MIFGPVFNIELVTTARRARYYVTRLIYGLVILFQVYLTYQSQAWRWGFGRTEPLISEIADFGRSMFYSFAYIQIFVMLVLTPALVAGTIAEERQRKTLHYLLASQLTGFEIVVGKLTARLLHVVVLIFAGLPVVALIGLFGGVDFEVLLASYVGTLSTVYFLAGLSILVSVGARRPREAISAAYILELIWLFGPTTLMSALPSLQAPWPALAEWVNPVLRWVACTSPISLAISSLIGGGTIASYQPLIEMVASQVIYGTAFVLLAAFRLRPAFRSDGAGWLRVRWLERLGARRRWWARPPIGNRAMLWKECYSSRSKGLTRAAMNLLAVATVGTVGYWTVWLIIPAVDEFRLVGWLGGGSARQGFSTFLKALSGILYVLWGLGLATATASGVTGEREEDTWISLTSTMLEGEEVLRAKMLGPAWGLRGLLGLLGLLWALGFGVGSVHPLGLLVCSVEFVVFSGFMAALGTNFSLHSKSSTRALALTMATLAFCNGGYLFCCIPFAINGGGGGGSMLFAGVTPVLFGVSLMSHDDLMPTLYRNNLEFVAPVVLSILGYGFAALALTGSAIGEFDQVVGRPNRLTRGMPPGWVLDQLKDRKPPGAGDELS